MFIGKNKKFVRIVSIILISVIVLVMILATVLPYII